MFWKRLVKNSSEGCSGAMEVFGRTSRPQSVRVTLKTRAKEDKVCDIELLLHGAVNTVSNFITCMVIIASPPTHALELC